MHKHGITPTEALLLTAEHYRNTGGVVINAEEAEKNAKDIADPVLDDSGKPTVKDGKPVTKTRTDDEELDRLRAKYGQHKVRAILAEVKTLPADYKSAIERGSKIVMPSSPLSSTRLI